MPVQSQREAEADVKNWGFRHVFTWSDPPHAHYTPHSHSGLTTHLILSGQLTITYPQDQEPKKETFGVGARVDVDAGRQHEVWIGPEGCMPLFLVNAGLAAYVDTNFGVPKARLENETTLARMQVEVSERKQRPETDGAESCAALSSSLPLLLPANPIIHPLNPPGCAATIIGMTTSPAMLRGPTGVNGNISNLRASLSPTSSPPRLMVQATESPPVNGTNGRVSSSTSKVIERLTSDNDRLRRELRAERAAKEEAEESLRVQKGVISSLRSAQLNLEHVHASDKMLAERKDRRIAQLKESLDAEVLRRTSAEDKSKEIGNKLGEATATAQREVSDAQIAAKRAEAAYDTLKGSYDQLRGEMLAVRRRVNQVEKENRNLDSNIRRISILGEERDKHQAAAQRANAQLRRRLDEYEAHDARVAALEADMEEAVRAMRWVVKLHEPDNSKPGP